MKTKLLTLLLLISTEAALACSCIYISDYFCYTLGWFSDQSGFSIARVKILDFYDHYMDVQVTDHIKGMDLPDTLKIVGQDGFNCNYWLEEFSIEQELIVAIQESFFETEGYDLSGCGRYHLLLEGETVISPTLPGVENQDYEDFKAGINDCLISTSTRSEKESGFIAYPNPAGDHLELRIPAGATGLLTFTLFTPDGKPALTHTTSGEQTLRLNTAPLPPGLYFLRISTKGGRLVGSKRIVIQ